MKKLSLILLLTLLFCSAYADEMGILSSPEIVFPGKSERITISVKNSDAVKISVFDIDSEQRTIIRDRIPLAKGDNHLVWNGMDIDNQPLQPGNYILFIEGTHTSLSCPVNIGTEAPQILSITAPSIVFPGDTWSVQVKTNMPGTLLMRICPENEEEWVSVFEQEVTAGESTHYWNGMIRDIGVPYGQYAIQLQLKDREGNTGTPQQISLSVKPVSTPTPVPTPTPAPTPQLVIPSAVTTQAEETSYWTLPVGAMNEAAIWEVMMQPMTVIDGDQKEVYRLRRTPDMSQKADNVVGEITYASQGVHVLETLDNGWTLVEAYNSSYGPECQSRRGFGVTDELIQGYVETRLLKTYTPKTEYGLLIDKLYQRMYIFSDGKCIGELLVSTGLNNEKQSWNETPSGEFVMISRMGGFPAGNLWCAYGMRINDGCAIHEVPYIGDHETLGSQRDYSSTVPQLGKKASHGCIRVQKDKNEQGQNIKWLWDNIKVGTKVLIWDDTGRIMPYPDPQTPLYYNPDKGRYYHMDAYCSSVSEQFLPLQEFPYSELEDGHFSTLKPCKYCGKIMRPSEIDALNRENNK